MDDGSRTIPIQPMKFVEPSSSVPCGFNFHLARQNGYPNQAKERPNFYTRSRVLIQNGHMVQALLRSASLMVLV